MAFNTAYVEGLLKERKWNRARLSMRMKVSKANVTRVLNGNYDPGAKFIAGLLRAFPGIPLENFFTDGVDNEEQGARTGATPIRAPRC